jgi:hypothetical protein
MTGAGITEIVHSSRDVPQQMYTKKHGTSNYKKVFPQYRHISDSL